MKQNDSNLERREDCPIHGVALKRRSVPIRYGRRGSSLKLAPHYLAARQALFPHCDEVVGGGCIVRDVKRKSIMICPNCCAARDQWLRENHPSWAATHKLNDW